MRNFLISAADFRYVLEIYKTNIEADGSAEFTVDLGSEQGIMTVYA